MKSIILIVTLVALIGCQQQESTKVNTNGKQLPAGMLSAPNQTSPSGAQGALTGTVCEVINVTGYTYLRLKTSNGDVWAAVQTANVKNGDVVTVFDAAPMNGFESKTLKRRFDQIFFGSLSPAVAPAAVQDQIDAGQIKSVNKQEMLAKTHAVVMNPQTDQGLIKVKKAEGAEGKTVAEIFAAKATLKDAPVAVRGKVVKYNSGILGKNWLHLRDGSGSPEKNNCDITVTTLDAAAVGDTVVIKGKVRIDRDFGAGYAYPVIIEDAKVSK